MRKRFMYTILSSLLIMSVTLIAGSQVDLNDKQTPADQPRSVPASTYSGKMQLSDDFFDYGYLPRNAKVSHIFWLKNVGTDTLEIISIKPG